MSRASLSMPHPFFCRAAPMILFLERKNRYASVGFLSSLNQHIGLVCKNFRQATAEVTKSLLTIKTAKYEEIQDIPYTCCWWCLAKISVTGYGCCWWNRRHRHTKERKRFLHIIKVHSISFHFLIPFLRREIVWSF